MLKRAVQIVVTFVVWSGLLFLAAGTLDWPRAWLLLGLNLAALALNFYLVWRFNPQIAETRSKIRAGTKSWDTVLIPIYGVLYLGYPVVAGLDAVRYGWSSLPVFWIYPGILLYVIGSALTLWVLLTNPFLETTVRIQTERGHHAVTHGPYAIVRHPMYSGSILQYLSFPLILGSAWSLAVSLAVIAVVVIRTGLEDKTLYNELPGYADYTRQTRHRLLPGVW